MLLALAYPFRCMVVLYVAILSCDDHRLGWWEQMGEVLVVNMGMVIPPLSRLGWILHFSSWCLSFGPWPLYSLFLNCKLLVKLLSCFIGIVVCLVL